MATNVLQLLFRLHFPRKTLSSHSANLSAPHSARRLSLSCYCRGRCEESKLPHSLLSANNLSEAIFDEKCEVRGRRKVEKKEASSREPLHSCMFTLIQTVLTPFEVLLFLDYVRKCLERIPVGSSAMASALAAAGMRKMLKCAHCAARSEVLKVPQLHLEWKRIALLFIWPLSVPDSFAARVFDLFACAIGESDGTRGRCSGGRSRFTRAMESSQKRPALFGRYMTAISTRSNVCFYI